LSDPTAATASAGPRPKYKRRLGNYLLDKKLQLRYVLVVTILSGLIATALGFMIYRQERAASESIEGDLVILAGQDATQQGMKEHIASSLDSGDKALVYKMVGVGAGLVLILSLYLVIMTHKVAGPLFKVSMYFDRMHDGRLGAVYNLRKGDMLQDFFSQFKEMHEAVRARAVADVDELEKAVASLRASHGAKLASELDALEQHVAARKKNLA
jgi:hypothetical protein